MDTALSAGHMDTALSAGYTDTALSAGHKDTVLSAGYIDTVPSAGHTDTALSAGHMDTALSAGYMDTGPSAGHMDTAPSSGHKDTEPPAGHTDAAPPAGHMITAPPAGRTDTALSAGHMDTALSAGHMDTALSAGYMDTEPPAGHTDAAPPAGHMITAPPAGRTDTALSAGHMDTALSASHKDTVLSAGHTDTALSAGYMDTVLSAGHMDTALSAGYMDTGPSAGHMDTALSAGHMDTALSAGYMDRGPSAGHMDTALSAGYMDTEPPAGHTDAAPPAGHMITAPPASRTDTAPHAGDTDTAQPAGQTDTAPPAGHTDTAPHAGHTDTAPPACHMDTAQPAGCTDTAPPAGDTDTAQPAGRTDTAPPAGHTDTAPPAGHMDTAPPACHMDTAPPEDGTKKNEEEWEIVDNDSSPSPTAGGGHFGFQEKSIIGQSEEKMEATGPQPKIQKKGLSAPTSVICRRGVLSHLQYMTATSVPFINEEEPKRSSCTEIQKSVGIFCWDMDAHMKSLLNSPVSTIGPTSAIPVSRLSENEWNQVQRFSVVIVIYSSQTGPSSMKRFLDFYTSKHDARAHATLNASELAHRGLRLVAADRSVTASPGERSSPRAGNMIKVIIDSEDAESLERNHSEWGQSPPCPKVTLTEAELDAISPSDDVPIGRRMADKVKQIRKLLQVDADNSHLRRLSYNKPVIGIFSRQAESQYSWLMSALRSHPDRDDIPELRPCCISNNGLQQFYRDLSQCKFGILYHSKNRGRVNVTDMEGALYDEELKDLSSRYGKDNVIVVIDDLEDSSDQKKRRILSDQPSIGTKAADLFLISLEEKKSNYLRYLMVTKEQAEKKLQELTGVIREMIPGEKTERLIPGAREKSEIKEQNKSKSQENITQTASGAHRGEETESSMPLPGTREKSEIKEQNKSKSQENITQTASGAHQADAQNTEKSRDGENKRGTELVLQAEAGKAKNLYHGESKQSTSSYTTDSAPLVFYKKSIGIFSRSSESNYSWLKMLLESQDLSNYVQSVCSCPVSNVFSEFCNEVTRCTFGILYHSKNKGRINVTDVTDSLYDEELKLLSSKLGKKNVVVVIDDLDDASDAMKNKLLSAQHSIEKLARDLILVQRSSSEEKRRATRDALEKVFQ